MSALDKGVPRCSLCEDISVPVRTADDTTTVLACPTCDGGLYAALLGRKHLHPVQRPEAAA